jgi:hypothetical protein
MAKLDISGRLTVKGLKARFKETFGLELRVYNGSIFADEDATLASLASKKSKKVDDFECRSNMLVANFETNFENATGLTVQIATLPNARQEPNLLVNNKFTLGEASEKFRPL